MLRKLGRNEYAWASIQGVLVGTLFMAVIYSPRIMQVVSPFTGLAAAAMAAIMLCRKPVNLA
jgi:hypothetical protein